MVNLHIWPSHARMHPWAANPNKEITKDVDTPYSLDLTINEQDKAILRAAGYKDNCIAAPAKFLVLRQRATWLAEGVVLSNEPTCMPIASVMSDRQRIVSAKVTR